MIEDLSEGQKRTVGMLSAIAGPPQDVDVVEGEWYDVGYATLKWDYTYVYLTPEGKICNLIIEEDDPERMMDIFRRINK